MLRVVAKGLRAVSRRFGVDLVRYQPTRSLAFMRQHVLRDEGVTLVFDVGANRGQYASRLRALGYAGRIVSFEPLSDAFAKLSGQAARDPKWECVRCAVGDSDGEAVIHIAGNSESSSLLSMGERHLSSAPESAYVGTETVPLRRLDALHSRHSSVGDRIFLKLDVQGYEKQALRGATETLGRVVAIESELSLVPLYTGQALLHEVVELLDTSGFALVWLEPGFSDPSAGHILQMDGLFVRRPPGDV